jgi:hypothetical protein
MIFIGVSGHRFLTEVDKLRAGIDRALTRIDLSFPGEAWSVISSLAEGADRLAVERILMLRPSTRLSAALPLPVDEYQRDFTTDESKKEFRHWLALSSEVIQMPAAASRDEAYWAAGEYLLGHSQVLLAVWDGQGAQGKGGTGEMVAAARQRGLPIAWVHAGNRKPGTNEPTSLGEEQGEVSFEGL